MLENQSKKILLLSDDPADASFLAEIAVTQQADLELALNAADLCSKMAIFSADHSLAAIFVNVSTPSLLRKFEFELQSKMGSSRAAELSSMIHFISGVPLALHREIIQSPYFSFYSERKISDFFHSSEFYQLSFRRAVEFLSAQPLAFNQTTRTTCFEIIKKELLLKNVSAEWILRAKNIFEEMLDQLFPARFDCTIQFSNGIFSIALRSSNELSKEQFRVENILEFGMSVTISSKNLVLFSPVFSVLSDASASFKFYKVEHE